jgi:hypothetical protein
MALASSVDVAERLGRPLKADESTRADGLLDEASALVSGHLRRIPDPVPDAVRIVVSRMVARVFAAAASGTGPDPGVSQMSQTMGPFAFTRGYTSEASAGGVWLTKQDKMMLSPFGCRGAAANFGTSRF